MALAVRNVMRRALGGPAVLVAVVLSVVLGVAGASAAVIGLHGGTLSFYRLAAPPPTPTQVPEPVEAEEPEDADGPQPAQPTATLAAPPPTPTQVPEPVEAEEPEDADGPQPDLPTATPSGYRSHGHHDDSEEQE